MPYEYYNTNQKGDFFMIKAKIGVSVDPDVKRVFDEQRGLAKESTYANYIMRAYFTERGLLPLKESA